MNRRGGLSVARVRLPMNAMRLSWCHPGLVQVGGCGPILKPNGKAILSDARNTV